MVEYVGLQFDLQIRLSDPQTKDYRTFNLGKSGVATEAFFSYVDKIWAKKTKGYGKKLKNALASVEDRIMFEIQSNILNEGDGRWEPWSEAYRNWRTVQRERGRAIQGDKTHIFSGTFQDNLRRYMNRRLDLSPEERVVKSGDNYILHFQLGFRGHVRNQMEQAQFGQPTGHSVGTARKDGVKDPPMIWPLTEAQAANPDIGVDTYISGVPIKFIASRGKSLRANPNPSTHPIPPRPLIDEERVEQIFREEMSGIAKTFNK